MKLSELLGPWFSGENPIPNIEVSGLAIDSRVVKPGDLFFAYPGVKFDRRQYIDQAIERGAVAVVEESGESTALFRSVRVPIFGLSQVQSKVSRIADRWYGSPSQAMRVIGITGTSGKTSISHLLAQALHLLGGLSGVIGSLGTGVLGSLAENENKMTLPDPLTVQRILSHLRDQGAQAVTLEATSHALVQGRLSGVNVSVGVLTRIARDHFDYHRTLEAYAAAKRMLFELPTIRYAVFNVDDAYGRRWAEEFKERYPVCGYTLTGRQDVSVPIVSATEVVPSESGMEVQVSTPWGEGRFSSPLLGRFNASNLLSVIGVLGLLGYPLKQILPILPALPTVLGRMQMLGGGDKASVVIDYAHKPDALEQVLLELRLHCPGKLICVFGCGGDRDRGKRPIMGQLSERLADRVIVTSDNPRFEDPLTIIEDILAGIENRARVSVEPDRVQAIRLALGEARPGDIVLLAGKGHETYQIIGDQYFHLSDEAIVREIG